MDIVANWMNPQADESEIAITKALVKYMN